MELRVVTPFSWTRASFCRPLKVAIESHGMATELMKTSGWIGDSFGGERTGFQGIPRGSTRPVAQNGLGLSCENALHNVEEFSSMGVCFEETDVVL